jgi:murein L,D-transpeptidase YcbB/YkuD
MKIIVGKPYRQTPEFSERMTYLVLNPSWYVPRRIALRDKLPLIEKDPSYLERNGYVLYKRGAESQQVIDPMTVDWQSPQARTFPYRLRQVPGANNALGRIKFMLPNRFNVYLHDTPNRELFSRSSRTFSSGCIRLDQPLRLAVWVMQGDPDWDRSSLKEAIASGKERVVKLPQSIPVDLVYLTAWGDVDGNAQFREDIYRRDARVAEALDRPRRIR